MENKEKHIDQILLSKAYNELSAEEFLAIKKEISSESEYNDLRTMLIAASNEINTAEEIEPREETKSFLMKEFTRIHPATRTRAGGLGFLFPKDKAFFQKPGYQILAVAAVLLLIFTIYPKLTENITSNDEMAEHQVTEPVKKTQEEKLSEKTKEAEKNETTGEAITLEDVPNEVDEQNDQFVASNKGNLKSELQANSELKTANEKGDAKDKVVVSDGVMDEANEVIPAPPMQEQPVSDAIADDEVNNNAFATNVATGASNDLSDYEDINSGSKTTTLDMDMSSAGGVYEDSEIAMVAEEEALEEASVEKETTAKSIESLRAYKKEDAAPKSVKKVKSLAENAELIELFYTAM